MTAQISPELSANSLQTNNSNGMMNTPEEWMKTHVNSFLQFYDSKLGSQYFDFHTANKTYVPKTSAGLFVLFILVPYTLAFIVNQFALSQLDNNERFASLLFVIIVIALYFFTSLFLISFLILTGNLSMKNIKGVMTGVYLSRKVAYLGITVAICCHFILRTEFGQCSDNTLELKNWICNPHAESNGLPADSVLLVIVAPRLLSLVMREVEAWIQGLCWLMGFASLIYCAVAVSSCESFYLLIVFILGLALILYDSTCHKLTLFYRYELLRHTLKENERKADEVNANEMRHMIGNVAHDLKTPLASFLSGIEYIIEVVNEFRSKLTSSTTASTVTTTEMNESLQAITDCTKNMTATNQFMLMAINRCIDYTKVTKGLQLKPKYETIDLLETLSLPLNCMADIQSNMTITLLPISKRICSHIITDKQWLQENLLCVLSNAVKYSSEGEVTISLSLNTESRHQPGFLNKMKTFAPMSLRRIVSDNHPIDDLNTSATALDTLEEGFAHSSGNKNANVQSSDLGITVSSTTLTTTSRNELSPRTLVDRNNSSLNTISRGFTLKSKGFSEDDGSEKSNPTIRTTRPLPAAEIFLRFEIEDTGIGIEEEAMENLFTPFKQAQRMAGGTGLGLYSLAKRVEALKGHYGVKPRRDGRQGTLFWFEFPYRPDRFFASMNKNNSDAVRGANSPINNNPETSNSNLPRAISSSPPPSQHITIDVSTSPLTPTTVVNMARGDVSPLSDHYGDLLPNGQLDPNSNNASSSSLAMHPSSFALKLPKKPLHVLVVDDAPSIIKMTTMMLKRGGHKITTAVTGADAFQKYLQSVPGTSNYSPESQAFDVIIMDLQMPIMDGLEATRRIRRFETTGSFQSTKHVLLPHSIGNPIPSSHQIVIGCSANSDDETIEEAYNAGVDAFMAKPFSIDTFYQTYDELVHQTQESSYPELPIAITAVNSDNNQSNNNESSSKSGVSLVLPPLKLINPVTADLQEK